MKDFQSIAQEKEALLKGRLSSDSPEGEIRFRALKEDLARSGLAEEPYRKDCPEALYWWGVTLRDLSYEQFLAGWNRKITVSMTSWPKRISYLRDTLDSVLRQSRRPDEILLWLAEEEFPGKEADLPAWLRDLEREGTVRIRWCDNLKAHKKYFYALQEVTEGVIVTLDDDLLYDGDLIELLMLCQIRHPGMIAATRTHLMTMDEEEAFLPYKYWIRETDGLTDQPCMQLMATTGAGTLYPAGVFDERLFDREALLSACPDADDIWMKCAEVMMGLPVVLACYARELKPVDGSQEISLWSANLTGNDVQLRQAVAFFESRSGEGAFIQKMKDNPFTNQTGIRTYCEHAWRQVNERNETIRRERKYKEYLIREIRKREDRIRELEDRTNELTRELALAKRNPVRRAASYLKKRLTGG